jgi:hypothetical protein
MTGFDLYHIVTYINKTGVFHPSGSNLGIPLHLQYQSGTTGPASQVPFYNPTSPIIVDDI